ncbi:hypothetical protein GGF31_006981 [Allomyces arbusculus]|nr:hypothetical protein GGF31_006981 [Allomyces arbusculus]
MKHHLYAYPYPAWTPAASSSTGMLSPPASVTPGRRSDAREFDMWVPPLPPQPPHAVVFSTPAHACARACSTEARPLPRAATTTPASTPPTLREFWTAPRPSLAGPREFWTTPACADAGLPPTPPTPTSPALTVPAADCAPSQPPVRIADAMKAADELRMTGGVWPVSTRASAPAEGGVQARPLVPLVPVVPVRQQQRRSAPFRKPYDRRSAP